MSNRGEWFILLFNIFVATMIHKAFFIKHVSDSFAENNSIVSKSANYSFTVTRPVYLKASWRTEINPTAVATMAVVILLTILATVFLNRRRSPRKTLQ